MIPHVAFELNLFVRLASRPRTLPFFLLSLHFVSFAVLSLLHFGSFVYIFETKICEPTSMGRMTMFYSIIQSMDDCTIVILFCFHVHSIGNWIRGGGKKMVNNLII